MIKIVFTLAFIIFINGGASAGEPDLYFNLEQKINATLDDKIQLTLEKEQLEEQINELQIKIKTKRALLLKRLKALYSLKKFKWGELLTNSSINELDRNLKILTKLNRFDLELFKDFRLSLQQLMISRANLTETEKLLQKNIDAYTEQQNSLYKIENERILLLQKAQINSLLVLKGQLARPLESSPKVDFGALRDQQNKFYLINRGELYVGKTNMGVRAVGLGEVIFRDALTHWRETLIVKHDDNYYSVYAGIKNSKKLVGDTVERGELIGNTSEKEFYFELRHFDNPINPKKWYKERL